MRRKASVLKKLTVAALLSAVGCTTHQTLTSLRPGKRTSSVEVASAPRTKKGKKKNEGDIVLVSSEEGPSLGTTAEEGPSLEPVGPGEMPHLEKVPECPIINTRSETPPKKPRPETPPKKPRPEAPPKRPIPTKEKGVVRAGFIEPPPPPAKLAPGVEALPMPTKSPSKAEDLPLPSKEGPSLTGPSIVGEELVLPQPDLTLEEAIHVTLGANPDLETAAERTQFADGVLARARADFFPVLALSQNYQISDNPLRKFSSLLSQGISDPGTLFNPANTVDNFQTQLRLQQEVYNGGARVARTRSAEAERDASHHSLAAVQNRIVFQVAESYYRLFQARELVKVREESVKQVEEQLKAVQARFKAQSAVRSDVLRVEVRLASVREALITAKNSLSLAWAVLENVTGVPLAGRMLPEKLLPAPWSSHLTEILASAEGESNGEACSPLISALAEAVSRRPEVNEINSRREAAEQRIRAAEAGKKPTLGVTSDYEIFTGDFRSKQTDGSFTVGVNLSVNLFDGGRTKSMVRQAQAAARELDAQQRRVRLDITLDVRRAYLQLKDATERLKVAETTVSNAEEILKQVQSRYANQTAPLTDLLDAQVALTEARVRATNADAEVEVARAALERAIGRLNDVLGGPPETHGIPHISEHEVIHAEHEVIHTEHGPVHAEQGVIYLEHGKVPSGSHVFPHPAQHIETKPGYAEPTGTTPTAVKLD